MKKVQSGFTLIELMISVAIVGILASVALPAYQDFTRSGNGVHMMNAAQQFAKAAGQAVQASQVTNTTIALGANGVPSDTQLESGDVVSDAAVAAGVLTLTAADDKVGAGTAGNTVTVTIAADGTATFGGTCITSGICKD